MNDQTIPYDQYGQYPALAGMVPASVGKRVGAVVLDSVVGIAIYLMLVMLVLGGSSDGSLISISGVLFLQGILAVVAILVAITKGARLGGLLLGVQYVDVATGRTNGARTIGKLLLEGVVQSVGFGIVWPIVCLVTLAKPSNRHAFDRALGLIAIDARLGRGPISGHENLAASSVPAVVPPPPGVPIASVTMGGLSAPSGQVQPVSPVTMSLPQPAPIQPPAPMPLAAPPPVAAGSVAAASVRAADDTVTAQAAFGPAWPQSAPLPSPASATPAGGAFISSTPFSRSSDRAVPQVAPVEPPIAVREMRSVDADLVDRTILDAAAFLEQPASSARLLLDGSQPIALDTPVILGRNPMVRPGLEGARTIPVGDTGMSISKSHVALGADASGVWALDLNSTNGTRLVDASGTPTRLVPGERTVLRPGSTLHFGGHQVRVES